MQLVDVLEFKKGDGPMRRMNILILVGLSLSVEAAASDGSIVGEWRRRCFSDGRDYSAVFTESTLSIIERHFVDGCRTLAYTIEKSGAYVVGDSDIPNSQTLDITVAGMVITPRSELAVSVFNDHQVCGFDAWEAEIGVEVTGRLCNREQYPEVGDTVYDLVRIQNNSLVFGDSKGWSEIRSPDRRPIEFNFDDVFDRQH
jgi:hypothetical protein